MTFRKVYCDLYQRATQEQDYHIESREEECKMYNSLIKSLPEDDRTVVSQCLDRIIKKYQSQHPSTKVKTISYKPKAVGGNKKSKIYIYDLESLPDPLSDMLILCLREHIFPAG